MSVGRVSTNFGAAATDYATFRAGFPESFFDRLVALGICRPGTTVVDVGTGTGTVARGFARRGASVIAIDPDDRMVAEAMVLDRTLSVTIEYLKGTAEAMPVPDAAADVVTAGQCWHWFDGVKAATEFARVVRPGGHVVVAHFDWLPLPGTVVEATERLIKVHNPDWRFDGGNGFHPGSIALLYGAGFRGIETFSYDLDVPYSPEAWRGRIRASAGVGAALDAAGIQTFDDAHARMLAESFPGDLLQTPHRVFFVVGRR